MTMDTVDKSQRPADNPKQISCRDPAAVKKIVSALTGFIPVAAPGNNRVVVCIGSDRSTGDALGPIVGTFLSSLKLSGTIILGTLASPVHALNLEPTIAELVRPGKQCPLVIAVDASLGRPERIGIIEVGAGPLFPGKGVNKSLPPVGHLYLSGVVNVGGFMEQMVLQSTRLFQVMELAAAISAALHQFLVSGGQDKPLPAYPNQLENYLLKTLAAPKYN